MSDRNGDDFDIYDLDKHRLDEEWVNQPKMYWEAATKLADLRRDLEVVKGALDVVEAEVKMDIRKNPSAYGCEKLTEDAVKSLVILSKRQQEAARKVIDAEHLVGVQSALVQRLDHRKKGLESLVQLQLANYYSQPRVKDREASDKMESSKRDKAFGRSRR